MAIENKVKKGDVVALKIVTVTRYVHGMRPAETVTAYELARVAKASREGAAQEVVRPGRTVERIAYNRFQVMAITDADKQAAARRVYDRLGPDDAFASAEELKGAIVAAEEEIAKRGELFPVVRDALALRRRWIDGADPRGRLAARAKLRATVESMTRAAWQQFYNEVQALLDGRELT